MPSRRPPLIIDELEIEMLLQRLDSALTQVTSVLRRND